MGDGAVFFFVVVVRSDVRPSAGLDVILEHAAARNVIRAGTIGKRDVHVAIDDFSAVRHESSGGACDDFPCGATVMADLQVVLGFGCADVNGCGAAVGELALCRVEHHEAYAIHAVQAAFCRGREGYLVKACPSLAGIGALVNALGAASAEDDVRFVRVYGEFFTRLAAHAVTVGEHFHIARVPTGSHVGGAQNCGAALAKIAGSAEHVNLFRVLWVERKSFGAVQAHVVLADPVHQRDPAAVGSVPAVNAADVGTGVNKPFYGRTRHNGADESAAVKADVAPVVLFGVCGRGECGQGGDSYHRCLD